MKKLNAIILLMLLCYNAQLAFGEELKFEIETINNHSQLPSMECRRIHQDKEGFMWLGTTRGIIRYDGYNFVQFAFDDKDSDIIKHNDISSIDDDAQRVWIGTLRGVYVYDKQSQNIKILDKRLNRYRVYKILCVGDYVWIATRPNLYRYDPQNGELKKYVINKQLPNGNINDMLLDANGDLWIGATYHKGLYKYNPKTDEFDIYPSIFRTHSPVTLFQDRARNIWVGSWGEGVVCLTQYGTDAEQIKLKRYDRESSISGTVVYSIGEHENTNSIWIGHHKGVSILQNPQTNNQFQSIAFDGSQNSILNNSVSAVYCDSLGDIWLGTMGGGVSKASFSNEVFEYNPLLEVSKKFNSRFVTSLLEDDYGRLWMAIKDSGLIVYDKNTNEYIDIVKNKAHRQIFANNRIRTIFSIGDNIYIGTSGKGIFYGKMPSKNSQTIQFKRLTIDNVKFAQYATTSHKDKSGNCWIGLGDKVVVLDSLGNYITQSQLFEQERDTAITSITSDDQGNTWIGCKFSGVVKCRLSDKNISFENFNTANAKLPSNTIASILADSKGRIWASTNNGDLLLYDKQSNKFTSQKQRYNLTISQLYNLFEDKNGSIWGCTPNSIIKFNGDTYRIFSVKEGNWSNVINEQCNVVSHKDNSFTLGGFSGITTLYPDKIAPSIQSSPLAITQIQVNHIPIYKSDRFEQIVRDDKSLKLSHTENNVSVEFAALSYRDANNIKYAYKLGGFDKDWNYVDADKRYATYTNLPAGEYSLLIKSTFGHGLWNDDITTLNIKVQPSPFFMWWAYLIYAVLIAAILFISYRIISHRAKLTRSLKFADFRNKQNELLTQTKLQFFTNISHELLTPLTIIGCATEQIAAENNAQNKDSLSILRDNTERLMRLIRQVLEFRKMENDKLKLQVSNVNLTQYVKNICDKGFMLLAEKKCIDFNIETPNEDIYGWIDTDKLDKILYNLLANAFKYNYDNSFVNVNLSTFENENGEHFADIAVVDGGIGIAPDKLESIFSRFYDGMYRQNKVQGSGIGLSLTKSLVALHRGSIEVKSQLGSGSEFRVILPIDKQNFESEQILEQPISVEVQQIPNDAEGEVQEKKNILVVEDNDDLRKMIVSILSKSHTPYSAANGCEALELLRENTIDVVISDVMMPVMDGMALCRAIKNDIELSSIPVILLTAKDMEEDKIQGYEAGADAYISKPFKSELLLSRINNILMARKSLIERFQNSKSENIKLADITYTTLDEKLMQKAIEVVQENISNEDFNFNTFADDMNISKSTLYRKIKALTGMTTSDFIKDIRLRQAATILKSNPSISVSEVSYLVGFGQPKYFSMCFKKKFNILPSEYASEAINDEVAPN